MKESSRNLLRNLLIGAALVLSVSACNHTSKQKTNTSKVDPVASQTENSQVQTPQNNTQQQSQAPTPAKPKKIKAPNFTLTRINGQKFELSKHFGKVIVLNIWATWCPPCRHEIPDFVKLQKEFRNKGVLFVGVSVDKKGKAVVKPFAKSHHMNYPVMVDNGTVNQEYGPIKYIPTTFVIGRDGYIKGYQPGMLTNGELKPVLEKLVKQKS